MLLCYPPLPLEWIYISYRGVANAHRGRAHLILHGLQPCLFFLLFLFLNILIQVLDIGGWLRLFSLRLLLAWTSLSLVLRLHFLLVLLDDVEEVLGHEQLVAEPVQQENETDGDRGGNEQVSLSAAEDLQVPLVDLLVVFV